MQHHPVNISLIWAQGAGGEMGLNNSLPWHLPEDLAHFKAITRGGAVLMGRRTWESLPQSGLPGRECFVLTSNLLFSTRGLAHCTMVESIADALRKAAIAGYRELFIIGGPGILKDALPIAVTLHVTRIHRTFAADVFAEIAQDDIELGFKLAQSEKHTSATGCQFTIERWERKFKSLTVTIPETPLLKFGAAAVALPMCDSTC